MNGTGRATVVTGTMKNQIKTVLLLGVLSAILIGFGALLGRQWVVGFTIPAMALNLFSTHPPMAERIRRLRSMTLARYAA